MVKKKKKYVIIGVDEAGRGPLAGPITVAAVAATVKFIPRLALKNFEGLRSGQKFWTPKFLKNIKDSKKLSAKRREEWVGIIKKNFEYKTAMVGPRVIDRIGINPATKLAVNRVLRNLLRNKLRNKPPDLILLDGAMSAPKHYNQKTIIRGDEKIPLISAASIVAKVARDKKMERLHKNCPEYNFDCHKGYGTELHYKLIKKNGISKIHRKSYLKNLC